MIMNYENECPQKRSTTITPKNVVMLLSASDLERYGQIKEKNKSFHFLILGKKPSND